MSIYAPDGSSKSFSPRQNFIDVGFDLKRILNKILKNDTLVKLLYYNDSNIDSKPNLSDSEKAALINDYIKIVPKIPKDIDAKNYLIIQMDKFSAVNEDTRYRSFILSFDILCHPDNWIMDNYMLRPFRVMQELDSMFNVSKLHSLGPATFISANQLTISEELMGYSIYYSVYDFQ